MRIVPATPKAAMLAAGVLALVVMAASAWISMRQPWLGVAFEGADKGLQITAVAEDGPAAGILAPGDVVLSMAGRDGLSVGVRADDIVRDPDVFPTFAERNAFRERQSLIFRILREPVVTMRLADDRRLRVQPWPARPLASFPASFWLLCLFGVTAVMVGAAVWAVSRPLPAASWLLGSGLGALCLMASVNVIVSRELALDGALYPWLFFFYHLGSNAFTLCMIGLMWNYPRPLGRFPLIPLLLICMSLFMLNEFLLRVELPGNSVLIQVPLYWMTGILVMSGQWVKSRGRPLDRAVVKALIMLTGVLLVVFSTLYFTPLLVAGKPGVFLASGLSGLFFFYLALALIVRRYRLFDIDRWWAGLWMWVLAGILVVVIDMLLVAMVDISNPWALGLAVVAAGWLYLPLRQWVWAGIFRHQPRNIEHCVPMLLAHFMRGEHPDDLRMWHGVLEDVFRPLSVGKRDEAVANARVLDDGAKLLVPCPAQQSSLVLVHADKGRRLFNSGDAGLAQALFEIAERSAAQRKVYVLGMLDERRRIMRDLHDDIGGRLLTLVHMGGEEGNLAGEALKSLREIIYSLDSEKHETLDYALARLRIESLERCEQEGIAFEWHGSGDAEEIELTPRQFLNLMLICREALANVFLHAQASRVWMRHETDGKMFRMSVVNDGALAGAADATAGHGLRNMRARIEELGGSLETVCKGKDFCLRFSFPLQPGSS